MRLASYKETKGYITKQESLSVTLHVHTLHPRHPCIYLFSLEVNGAAKVLFAARGAALWQT